MSGVDRLNEKLSDIQKNLDELKTTFLDKKIDIEKSLSEPERHFEESVLSSLVVRNIVMAKEQIGILQGLLDVYSGGEIGGQVLKNIELQKVKANHKAKNTAYKNEEKDSGMVKEVIGLAEEIFPLGLDIIRLRDQLLIAWESADEKANKMISGIYNELGRLLSLNGIDPIEDDGYFDKMRHQVVDNHYTDNKELGDMIYETVRPGYCTKHKVLRPQEVILYKYRGEEKEN